MSIRTISNIYNFKVYRIVYKLKTKYMSTIEKLLTIANNLKVGKGKLSITKKKNYQKSRPKIMSADVDHAATAKVKSSETSPDLNG